MKKIYSYNKESKFTLFYSVYFINMSDHQFNIIYFLTQLFRWLELKMRAQVNTETNRPTAPKLEGQEEEVQAAPAGK